MSKETVQTRLWTTATAVFIALLTAYITTRPTKAEEGRALLDVVLVVFNAGALCALGYAVSLNLRDASRAKRLRGDIEGLKKFHAEALKYACAEKLRELDEKWRASEYPLLKSGKLHILAEDALLLSDQLGKILLENKTSMKPMNLTHPLSPQLLAVPVDMPIIWQKCRLLSFRNRLGAHLKHVVDVGLGNFAICTWVIPNDMTDKQIIAGLDAHRRALLEAEADLLRPYNDVRNLLAAEISRCQ